MDFKDSFRAFLLMEFLDLDRKKYNEACSMLDDGDYQGAFDAFCEIPAYEDSAEKMDECLYQMGLDAMQEEDWGTAAAYFEGLNFDCSEELLQSCREMLNIKKYNEAYPIPEDRDYLGAFAAFLIKKINVYLYRTGVEAMKKEDWETAVVCFEKLYFHDSEALLQSCREMQMNEKK